ncbi:MAG TPA: glycosyltransferase [Candidatus Omnitrophota bacterium]|nr:glycosyltransferase [Candidatus Omnitrophota bacterium]HQO57936.1 glycosyltransferase [Candidatus Omnitrophota bacterium]
MRCWNLLQILASRHKVLYVCFRQESDLVPEEVSRIADVIQAPPPVQREGKWWNYFYLLSSLFCIRPRCVGMRRSKAMQKMVRKLIPEKKIDLIFCDSVYYAVNLPSSKTRVVLNEHNLESKLLERALIFKKNPLSRFLLTDQLRKLKKYEEETWPFSDLVLMCSEIDRKEAECRCSKDVRFSVIPNGVDVSFFHLPDRDIPEINKIIFTAEMGWYPNVDAVLYFDKYIYPFIKKEVPDIQIDIVGKNPDLKVKELAMRDSSFRVTGFVDDIRPYVYSSAVYIVPLRIGSGTRLKILEAMAMGKAVVSTTIGAEGIEVTDGKDIFIADDPREFADRVIDLLKNPDKRKAMGLNGRKLVEQKYTWEVIGEKLEQDIQSVFKEI